MQDFELDSIHGAQSSLAVQNPDGVETTRSMNNTKTCTFQFRNNNTLRTIAGVGGNVLEWFDFAVFGYFSEVLGKVFFPPQEGLAATIESFSVFGLAFLCRPIGGLLLGYIGDVYGRKRALEISIFLMAFPTFLMGCLPTYAQVGSFSTVLLIAVRMLQGLSVGGQLVSSLVYTCESKPRSHWGFYGSFVMMSANIGTLLGGLLAFSLKSGLSDEQLLQWGWRIPFLSGILVSVCGIYLKYFCDDEALENLHGGEQSATLPQNPIFAAFSINNRRALFAAMLVPMVWASGFYVIFVWLAVFMDEMVEERVPGAFGVNSGALFLSVCVLFPVAGGMSDIFGRKKLMFIGAIGLGSLCPGLIVLISEGSRSVLHLNSTGTAFVAQLTMGMFLSCFGAPMCAFLVESFPPHMRLTSVAIGYNIANSIAAGSSPALATFFVDKFGNKSIFPGLIVTVFSVISMLGLTIVPSKSIFAEAAAKELEEVEMPDIQRREHSNNRYRPEKIDYDDNPEGLETDVPRHRGGNGPSLLYTIDNPEYNANPARTERAQVETGIMRGDDSYVSYDQDIDENNDGMSFGPSETDHDSVNGEFI